MRLVGILWLFISALVATNCSVGRSEAVPFFNSAELAFTRLASGTDEGRPYEFVGLDMGFSDVERSLVNAYTQNGWAVTRCCDGGGVFWAESDDGKTCVSYNNLADQEQRDALGGVIERHDAKALVEASKFQSAVLATASPCI